MMKNQNECVVGQVGQSLVLDLCTPSLYSNLIEDDDYKAIFYYNI